MLYKKTLASKNKSVAWRQNACKSQLRLSHSLVKAAKSCLTDYSKKKFKQGWRVIADRTVFFRSSWEANVGRYLQWQKENGVIKDWHHEPKTFWFVGIKRGCVSYLPDFKVIHLDDSHEWIEVKGYMDSKSRTKIKRFAKYFPEEKLRVLDSSWYKANSKSLSLILSGWE